MSEQLSLLDWRPPAEIVPFPAHRSHGCTVGAARAMARLETAKRTGKMNSLRAQTRKRLEPFVGADRAEQLADDLVRMIKVQSSYLPLPKQIQSGQSISSPKVGHILQFPHGDGGGAAIALGQGAKLLAGVGSAHGTSEQEVARACDRGLYYPPAR
jgi:hypothetical protein